MELRAYQTDCINKLRAEFSVGRRRVILQAATGSGKTVMASEVVRRAVERGNKVLILAHARELVTQMSDKLSRFGVDHSIVMRGKTNLSYAPVQVCSLWSLWSWWKRSRIQKPEADVIIIDEAHRSASRVWREVLSWYPEVKMVIGLTATPARNDGFGLADFYDAMVQAVPTPQLIRERFLVTTRIFAPTVPDLTKVKKNKTDWQKQSLQRTMNRPTLIADTCTSWEDIAVERPTLFFASGVRHSLSICERLTARGHKVAHVDGGTDIQERDDAVAAFLASDIIGLCNCDVFTEGTDLPLASCAVLARPTRSLIKYLQMAGRIQRPWEQKDDAILIDHSGAVYEHGFPDDDIEWTLERSTNIKDAKCKQGDPAQQQTITCPKCKAAFRGRPKCPECGHEFKPKSRHIPHIAGKLEKVDRDKIQAKRRASHNGEKQRTWDKFLGICIRNNWPVKRAAGMYQGHYGVYPNKDIKKVPRGKSQWQVPAREWYDRHVAGGE